MSFVGAETYRAPTKKPAPMADAVSVIHQITAKLVLIFGIGIVLMALYKYTEYRQNPDANPLGKVIGLLFTGLAMIGLALVPMQVLHIL